MRTSKEARLERERPLPNASEDRTEALEEALHMPPGEERIETLLTALVRGQQVIEGLLGRKGEANA